MLSMVGEHVYLPAATEQLRVRGLEAAEGRSMSQLASDFVEKIASIESMYHDDVALDIYALTEAIRMGRIVPGTPLWRKMLSQEADDGSAGGACTVINFEQSGSRDRVSDALSSGAGVGVDLSDEVDPVGALHALNEDVRELDDRLRAQSKRPVACMATLSSSHPRVLDFMQMKRDADFMDWRFNISVRSLDYLRERDSLIADFAENAHYCGEPGVLFWDRVDEMSSTPTMKPTSTAPCAEVALAEGEQCMFTYLNVVAYVKSGEVDFASVERDAARAVRMLDNATQICLEAAAHTPSWQQTRRVGVGAMGYADACIALNVAYGSTEATKFAQQFAASIFKGASMESARLAESRGSFPLYNESRFLDKRWISDVYARCLSSEDEGDVEYLDKLFDQISKHGMRNSSCVAFPPTGNASELVGVSKSLEPRRTQEDISEGLEVLRRFGALEGAPDPGSFVTEDQVSGTQHVDVQAAFQAASIDAVSKTVNLPQKATVADVQKIYDHAYATGCKGITVFRDGCLSERN